MTELENQIKTALHVITDDADVISIYCALAVQGPQTISRLARLSKVERTKIYRFLDDLQALNLIEVEIVAHRKIIHPVPLSEVEVMILSKKSVLDNAQGLLKDAHQKLMSRTTAPNGTSVKFYQGSEGLKQMLWNQTRAKGTICSILSENIQSHTSAEFFERWVSVCNEKKVPGRSLVDAHFIEQQKTYYGGRFGYSLHNWQARELPADMSTIPHRTTVYDDVTAYFSWDEGDLFGIEITNATIADNQRQYFELLWAQSTPLA